MTTPILQADSRCPWQPISKTSEDDLVQPAQATLGRGGSVEGRECEGEGVWREGVWRGGSVKGRECGGEGV